MTLAEKQSETKLAPDRTWIPVGAAIVGLIACFWAGVAYSEIISNQRAQGDTLRRIEEKVDAAAADGVSVRTLQSWIELLRARNANLTIPDIPR